MKILSRQEKVVKQHKRIGSSSCKLDELSKLANATSVAEKTKEEVADFKKNAVTTEEPIRQVSFLFVFASFGFETLLLSLLLIL